ESTQISPGTSFSKRGSPSFKRLDEFPRRYRRLQAIRVDERFSRGCEDRAELRKIVLEGSAAPFSGCGESEDCGEAGRCKVAPQTFRWALNRLILRRCHAPSIFGI